jgi:hypothetical protein
MQTVLPKDWWEGGQVHLKTLNGQLRAKGGHALEWRGFQGDAGKDRKLQASGGWDDDGDLAGTLSIKNGKDAQRFVLKGTREAPIFAEDQNQRGHK